jgi:ribosomal protein L37AE/L43A
MECTNVTRETARSCVPYGWNGIVNELYDAIDMFPGLTKIFQVKEKFGGLRIYYSTRSKTVEKKILWAEEESLETCSECGSKHASLLSRSGWLITLCGECSRKGDTKSNINFKFPIEGIDV